MRLYSSPWGPIQHQVTLAPGIVQVSTAGHGGIWISPERLAEMPEDIRTAKNYSGDPQWFEEDCDWAKVILAFPFAGKPESYYFAVQTCEQFEYLRHLVTPERKAKADRWLADNSDKWCSAGGMTGENAEGKRGWFESAEKLTDRSQRRNKWFPGVVVLPAVFTLEEFENAKLFNPHENEQLLLA